MIAPSKLQGVFEEQRGKRRLLMTRNLVPGVSVYGEFLHRREGVEYREWDPESSKICAALIKGLSQLGLKPGDVAMYLGCATGTTVSHVSDIVGEQGFVFAVDIAPRVLRELVFVSEDRPNMAPILCDANHPIELAQKSCQADWLFQDIAQRDQVGIFQKNVDLFLKPGGFGVVAIKARSIDVTKQPKDIFAQVRRVLEQNYTIVDYRDLDPFQKDHALFVIKKRMPGEPASSPSVSPHYSPAPRREFAPREVPHRDDRRVVRPDDRAPREFQRPSSPKRSFAPQPPSREFSQSAPRREFSHGQREAGQSPQGDRPGHNRPAPSNQAPRDGERKLTGKARKRMRMFNR